MSHPTATWKVTVPFGGADDAALPAIVWRNSESACEAWIESRIGREPQQAVLGYGWAGPLAPVPLPHAVIDLMRPPGEGRVVERFADPSEAEAWMRVQREVERLDATPGDYRQVGPDELEAALAAPALAVRRGGAVREVPPPPNEARPDLRPLERATLARRLSTALGEVEVRAYPDGHVRISAGTPFDAAVGAPPARLPEGGSLAFEAIVRLDNDRLASRGVRYELRDAEGQVVEGAAPVRAALDHARAAVREAVNGLLDTYPRDRDEALERHLVTVIARGDEERRSITVRLAALDRQNARAQGLLSEVRAKLAAEADEAEAEAPAPGF